MSSPQDMQGIMKTLGMGGGRMGPPQGFLPPGQTAKRGGAQRIPMSNERPQQNPGQVQDAAARKLGVQPHKLQPQEGYKPPQKAAPQQAPVQPKADDRPPTGETPPVNMRMPRPRPPEADIQAPAPPTLPKTTNMRMPPQRPLNLPREAGPPPMGVGQKVPEADINSVAWNIPGQTTPANAIVKVLGDMAGLSTRINTPEPTPEAPPRQGFQARREAVNAANRAKKEAPSAEKMVADTIDGGEKPQAKPGFSSAAAAPAAPATAPPDKWQQGVDPIQLDPRQLMPLVAAAVKAKAEQAAPPVQAPASKVPSATVTPPVPPGQPPATPEAYRPSQPSFKGYELMPPKPAKGDPKSKVKVGDKSNSLYYYTRIGVLPGDNAGVAQRLREVRAKASNPRTAKNMTEEEDRILAQYADAAIKKGDDALLMSMEPAAVAKRMQEYKSGRFGGAIPDRYQDRPPGVEPQSGEPVPLKLPPKAQEKRLDKAEKMANEAIQNPPKKATDPDKPKIVVEDD